MYDHNHPQTYEINMHVAHADCSSGWYLASRARTLMQLGRLLCTGQLTLPKSTTPESHTESVQPEVFSVCHPSFSDPSPLVRTQLTHSLSPVSSLQTLKSHISPFCSRRSRRAKTGTTPSAALIRTTSISSLLAA